MLLPLVLFTIRHNLLTVGAGQMYARIEVAVDAAHPGDVIEVYPGNYSDTAVLVNKPLTIRGVGDKPVHIDGGKFDYSGVGKVPRAIFQIDPEASGTKIERFELTGAHNASYNGAGVRINCANNVTIKECDIHGNDMGIMSNGRVGDDNAGKDQLIEHCLIHANGNSSDPGYNHNLYLGGTSVDLEFCEIFGSLTGHNLKSRAHFNLVRYCYIHDSANRECDFVEAWDTERPNSNAVLIGNVIVKDPNCTGNRATIHFGKERGKRDGALFLLNNTIVTPFASGLVVLDSPNGSVRLFNNVIVNAGQASPALVEVSGGAKASSVTGANNWISSGYDLSATGLDPNSRFSGKTWGENPLHPGFLVGRAMPQPIPAKYTDGEGHEIAPKLDWIYAGQGKWTGVKGPYLGAG